MKTFEVLQALVQLSRDPQCERVQYDVCLAPDYVPKFIMQTQWGCNKAHMFGKYKHYRRECGDGWAIPFYNSLDDTNSRAFCNWLERNATIRHLYRVIDKHGKVWVDTQYRSDFVEYCESHGMLVIVSGADEDRARYCVA